MIFFNKEITNTAMTDASLISGNAGLRQASKGLWNHGLDSGQKLQYSGTWDTGNFYDYKDLAISQLISSREVQFWYGYELSRQIEQANLEWIQSYSGGSDLFMNPSSIGVGVKYVDLDGFTFQLKDSVIIALIGSTTANIIGVFVIVLKYLFPSNRWLSLVL